MVQVRLYGCTLIIENTNMADKKAPNPYGKKGKPDHQQKVKEIVTVHTPIEKISF